MIEAQQTVACYDTGAHRGSLNDGLREVISFNNDLAVQSIEFAYLGVKKSPRRLDAMHHIAPPASSNARETAQSILDRAQE